MKAAATAGESKVVILGPDHHDSFAENIAVSFLDAGIDACVIDPRVRYGRPGALSQRTTARKLVTEATNRLPTVRSVMVDRPVERLLDAVSPDLVISVDGYFEPSQVARWRRRLPRSTWVLWYPDHLANLGTQTAFVADYDHLFFKDPHLVDLLSSRTRLPVHLLPEGCNPRFHRTEQCHDAAERDLYACDVAVAGSMYPYRRLLLHELPDHIDLKLYGGRPSGDAVLMRSYSGRYVTRRDKALAFGEAAIVLNTMHYAEIRSVNARLFEATACGGFVLTHASPVLDQYFDDGNEVVSFETPADLRAAVAHYLHAPEERARIAAAGQARAHRDHTLGQRLAQMLVTCDLDERLPLLSPAAS